MPGTPIHFTPIGIVRSPFAERIEAPRQATSAEATEGTIELFPGHNHEDALSDLEGWERIWVLFVFDRNESWRPKVLPPRSSGGRRGVFSTRSPHRPNPIGMSAVRLVGVSGLTVSVLGLDILDGTPVLDIKPYVPYADAFPASRVGWLADDLASGARLGGEVVHAPKDPLPDYDVAWDDNAAAKRDWLLEQFAIDIAPAVERALRLGPTPHAYRRIRQDGDGFVLASKEWRVRFVVAGRRVTVLDVMSGYRPRDLALGDAPFLEPHRAFVQRFGRCHGDVAK